MTLRMFAAPLRRLGAIAKRFRRDERGGVTTLFLAMVPVMIGVYAAAELAHVHFMRARLQATADAAALAAVHFMDDYGDARDEAQRIAAINMPEAQHGRVVPDANFAFGQWDADARVFTAGASPANALRVVAERSADNQNAMALPFVTMMGSATPDLHATAVMSFTTGPGGDCAEAAIIARGKMVWKDNLHVHDDVCVFSNKTLDVGKTFHLDPGAQFYARDRFEIKRNSHARDGARIGVLNADDLTVDNPSHGIDEAFFQADLDYGAGLDVVKIYYDMKNNDPDKIEPEYLDGSRSHVYSLPSNPVPGRTYIVYGSLRIKQNQTLRDIGVVVLGSVYVEKNVKLENVMIFSCGDIVFEGQNVNVGKNFCNATSGTHASGILLALDDIDLGKNVRLSGTQVIAYDDIRAGQNLYFEGSNLWSGGDFIQEANTGHVWSCANGEYPDTIPLGDGQVADANLVN